MKRIFLTFTLISYNLVLSQSTVSGNTLTTSQHVNAYGSQCTKENDSCTITIEATQETVPGICKSYGKYGLHCTQQPPEL